MELTMHRWVQGWHMNPGNVLFGGQMLSWVDEDCTMLCYLCCNEGTVLRTVGFDRVGFHAPAFLGDRLYFDYILAHVGKTSIGVRGRVYNQKGDPIFSCMNTHVSINGTVDLKQEVEEKIPYMKESYLWKLAEKIKRERRTDGMPIYNV